MASYRFVPAVRQFCTTAAARNSLTKAPIQLFGMEGRYAHALYSAASKEKALDAVEKEIKAFQSLVSTDAPLAEYLANPTIQKVEKTGTIQFVMKKKNVSMVTTNFFSAMAENGRLPKMNAIIGAFEKLMAAHRGEVICSVTTAKPLDAKNQKDLLAALGSFLAKGESLKLETIVDPSLIGGMVVNIGDKYVDMSISSKITTYTNLIKQAI